MKKCKHQNCEYINCYYEDHYLVEYDVYCKDCDEIIYHWAYGYPDVEYFISQMKWYKKIIYKIKNWVSLKIYKFRNKNIDNDDLPFEL